jgi:hypothetical protein
MTTVAYPALRIALATICLLAATVAGAQQRPLTGQMLGDTAPPPAAVAATPPAPPPYAPLLPPLPPTDPLPLPLPARAQIGDTTRALLQLQARGSHAGAHLPMLGEQASLSYARYLQSFTHPIPEFLDTSVRKQVTGDDNGE